MNPMQTAYDGLYTYTMGRPGFILQHAVDAFGAQTATKDTKPIRLVFSLIGLYLRTERGFSGQAVQKVHMQLGNHRTEWPSIALPSDRGEITPVEVMAAAEGDERDAAIDVWCRSVWSAFKDSRPVIVELLRKHGIQ
jgi:hypothetical protein